MPSKDEPPVSSSEVTPTKLLNSALPSENSEKLRDKIPALLIIGALAMATTIFILGRIAIVASERGDAEKTRADTLQQSIDALRLRTDQNRDFFEIVRELLVAQSEAEKQALLSQLRGFEFKTSDETTTTTTTTTTLPKSTSKRITTTTTPSSSATPAPSSSSPPTTTRSTPSTQPPATSQPPPIPTVTVCVTTPVAKICP